VTLPAVRVAEGHARTYRRSWRSSASVAFVSPALFLAAMGLGLGSLVDDAQQGGLGGLTYVEFLAPGLVAATAMQVAGTEGAFPVMHGTTWARTYYAMLATPVSATDIALGHLLWVATRVAISATAMVAVVAAFGVVASPLGILAVPVAVLVGAAVAGPVAAYAVGLRGAAGLAALNRFAILPLFLFSGTFFPVDQLPGWMETVAWAIPLWHGVELCRGLMTDSLDAGRAVLHLAYLLVWTVAGSWLAARRFTRRLVV
jgi:lipooligosaccharide transport system permease protein